MVVQFADDVWNLNEIIALLDWRAVVIAVLSAFMLTSFWLGFGVKKMAPNLHMGLCFFFSTGVAFLFYAAMILALAHHFYLGF